jgi:hypothetical protein
MHTIALITYDSITHARTQQHFVDSDVSIFEISSQSNGSNLFAVRLCQVMAKQGGHEEQPQDGTSLAPNAAW